MIQNMPKSAKITIFEGPDGSGKSTAARAYAQATGAKYVHMPAMPCVKDNLARMYVEAMMPAILGYQDIVMDRCWLSEAPYGAAFREGQNRLTVASQRMLERLALRCGAVVVMCRPAYEVVKTNYLSRRHLEMLTNESQLKMVYDSYRTVKTALPRIVYDYTRDGSITSEVFELAIHDMRPSRHPVDIKSAGNLKADIIIIGNNHAERKDCDPWYQWPFASFGEHGCSQWLTNEIDRIGLSEIELLWLGSDQDLEFICDLQPKIILTLGDDAYEQLYRLKLFSSKLVHPLTWMMSNPSRHYPLEKILEVEL